MKTILFVENDPVVVTMYRNRLQSEGFRIETAEDGLEALKVLSNITPDLVTLDLMLPKLSGADVLRFIRSDARLKHIPIILFSNAYMTELGEEAVLSSANKRLLKAYSTPALLLESIHELLAVAAVESASAAATNGAAASTAPTTPTTAVPIAPLANDNDSAISEKPQAATNESVSPLERQQFLKEVRSESAILHDHCRSYVKAPASKEGQQQLIKLHEVVHRLSANSSRTDCVRITCLMKAFDALLSEVMAKPAWASPSVLQTIAQAADCLDLVLKGEEAGTSGLTSSKVLVVDDDLVCNRVMVSSLKRTNLEAVSVQDPKEGLRLLQSNRFDAILLDVNMPEMTGFELCEQLRRLSHCKTTPVIFVTAYSNFQNRTQGVLSGGDDFITKPVSPLELALKVTIHMLKAHAQRGGAPLPAIQPPSPEVSASVLQSLAAMQVEQFKNGASSGQESNHFSTPANGTLTSTNPSMPPPIPTESVTVESQPPIASQPVVQEPAEVVGPVPPNLFLSTTETATSTGDAPAETEFQPAAVETSNESLQPVAAVTTDLNQSIASTEVSTPLVSEPVAVNIAAEATPPTAPSLLDTFLVDTPQPATQNVYPTASAQNSIAEAQPAAGTAWPQLPPMPELIAFTPPAPVSAVEPIFEPALPSETLQFLATELSAQNPPAPAALFPTTESQISFVESTSTPIPTPAATSEPVIANIFAEIPQPAAETHLNPNPNAETENPVVPEAQAPVTESLNSVFTADPPAPQLPTIEPAAENVFVAQPQPPAPSPENPTASSETVAALAECIAASSGTIAASLENITVSSETVAASPENTTASIEIVAASPEIAIALPETVTELTQPVVEPQTNPIPVADAEKPLALDSQAPVTEPLSSIVESTSSTSTMPEPTIEAFSPTIEAQPTQPDVSPLPEVISATEVFSPEIVSTDVASTEVAIQTDIAVVAEVATVTEVAATSEASVASTVVTNQNSAAPTESELVFDRIVHSVTCMIYGDSNATEMNLRLVRLALERYKVNELVPSLAASNTPQPGTGVH